MIEFVNSIVLFRWPNTSISNISLYVNIAIVFSCLAFGNKY